MQDLQEALNCLGFALGSSPTPHDLKRRWKELCVKFHPDKPGGNREDFEKVTHAFRMLTDADYRHKERDRAARRGSPNNRGALDLRMMIPVSFDDAFFGRPLHVSYSIYELDDEMQIKPVRDGDELEIDRLTIELTPGTSDGYQQLLHGRGHRYGSERGNLLVAIQVLPHAKFQMREGNIISTESIALDICLKGGSIEVMTMYGLRAVKVKAGTRPGDTLKIPGCGARSVVGFGLSHRADHYVTVQIHYPSREELRASKTWQRLDIDWEEETRQDPEMAEYLNMFDSLRGRRP